MKKLLKVLLCACAFVAISTYAANTQFSKVIFFGDSLSDVGNNHFNNEGQAPETNRVPNGQGGYKTGDVWVVPFVQNLKTDGLLDPNSTAKVVPSYYFDDSISVSPWDSIDFAYSGDPSGGLDDSDQSEAHPYMWGAWLPNYGCQKSGTDMAPPPPWAPNALCGALNRVDNFIPYAQGHSTTFPDPKKTLYVIWIGANDIIQNLKPDLVTAINDGTVIDPNATTQSAINTIQAATKHIQRMINNLYDYGARYFVVINLPNIGFTEDGYNLNALYASKHPGQTNVINQLFTNLTSGYNQQLNTVLDNVVSPPYGHQDATVIRVNIDDLFNKVRAGEVAAFPPSTLSLVNKEPVVQWFNTCCKVGGAQDFNYDPTQCNTSGENPLCSGPMPVIPDAKGGGHYLFFNDIHPTTCAHRYIATLITNDVEKQFLTNPKPFDPSVNLCTDNT